MNTLIIKSSTTLILPLVLGIIVTFLYKKSIPEKEMISQLNTGAISRSLGRVVQAQQIGSSLPYHLTEAEQKYLSSISQDNKKKIAEGILLSRSSNDEAEKLNELSQYIEQNQNESLESIESILNENVLASPLDRASLIEALTKISINPEKRAEIVRAELLKDVRLEDTTSPDDIFYLTYIKKSSYEILLQVTNQENILKETQDILEVQSDYNVQMAVKEALFNKYPVLAKEIGITINTFNNGVSND